MVVVSVNELGVKMMSTAGISLVGIGKFNFDLIIGFELNLSRIIELCQKIN